ncbi:MAG: hypothetical protein K2X74_00360 [Acetobacteraceae bacterium]|nr:hypothetical protein [Acetobacteraceae bacterium]
MAGLALALAACGGGAPSAPIACPRPSIPADAADLTRYRAGPVRDITTMEFDARLNGLSGGCRVGRRGESIDLLVTPAFVVDRGPAAAGRLVTVPWMVAVLDGETDEPLGRPQPFVTTVGFGPNETRASVNGQSVTIALPVSETRRATDYRVLVMLQLEEDELAHNRRRGPR